MTRDEAIDILRCRKDGNASDALEVLLRITEAQPCEDCVSREAVLQGMYDLCDTGETLKENPWRDNPHIDVIIDTIENLPPVTPKPMECEDAVSRKKVLYHLNLAIKDANDFMESAKKEGKEDFYMGRKYVATYIRNLVADMEPVTPKQRTGKWIVYKAVNTGEILSMKCGRCGYEVFRTPKFNYCPNCGAKMKGESE